jgi:hypothetical protein
MFPRLSALFCSTLNISGYMKPAWRPRSDTLGNNELEMIIKEEVVR